MPTEQCYYIIKVNTTYDPNTLSYFVVKRIKGKPYLYKQSTYRDKGIVKTKSEYIGALSPKNKAKVNTTKRLNSCFSKEGWKRISSTTNLLGFTAGIVWSAYSPADFISEYRAQLNNYGRFERERKIQKAKDSLGKLSEEENLFFSALIISPDD